MSIKLKQPIIGGSLRATNFFNGRLVTGADLTREQTARREAVWRVGKAVGEGIVYGLEVEKDSNSGANPAVSVKKGLAVSRCGQALYLAEDTSIDLLQRFGSVDEASKIFGDCQPLAVGSYMAGFGFYLLVLSPAESSEGSAPTSGLNNTFSACNTDVILETVQFNLLPIDTFVKSGAPVGKRLRNFIAYRCFGAAKLPNFFKDPLGFALDSYGLMDELRGKLLSNSDVPLAIINWTSEGLQFVENWAVRRRISRRDDDEDWTQIVKDRRLSETESMMMQFAAQIENLESEGANLPTIIAKDYFRHLPPAGILPVTSTANAGKPGFSPATFFGTKYSTPANLDGDLLPVLLEQALSHEPIDLDKAADDIQLYHVKENVAALGGTTIRKALVFARHSLPYLGEIVSVPVIKQKIFTFAPDFLPVNQRMPQQFDWVVTFNKAVIPNEALMKSDNVRGAFTVRLPDAAQLKTMIVRFKRFAQQGTPTAFFISLNRLEFDNPNANPEVLVNFDLKNLGQNPKETRPVAASDLGKVDNTKYHYFITAYWESAGSSDKFQINSMQIFCDVQE